MLEYEWGNPSSILLSGEEPTQDSDQTRQILDQYNQNLSGNLFSQANNNYHQSFHEQQQQQQQQQQTCSSPLHLYDPRIYTTTTTNNNNNHNLSYPPPTNFLPESMAAVASSNFMMMHKNEDINCGQRAPTTTAAASIDYSTRIGLNLGGRTYFSSEDDFVNRFYRRSRQLEPGPANIPKCQAEGCNADLTHAKHYHRRHKVCEFHSKAATVLTAGMITQRFCQQCSRFHLLTEFDQGKRSCRKRLADHNRRRRKSNPPQPPSQQQQQSQLRNTTTTTHNSSTDHQNTTRSSPDSGGMHSSSSSVTVAMSHMKCHALKRRT